MGHDYFALLRRPAAAPHGLRSRPPDRGPGAGVTVLIPTYTPPDGERVRSLLVCLDSVRRAAHAAGGVPIALVVVDNGMSASAARDVTAALRGTGYPYRIVAAPDHRGPNGVLPANRYTVARARNAGLAALAELPAESPLRQPYLLFLDDDTALAPAALGVLISALDGTPTAVAACPRVVPVPEPAAWLRAAAAESGLHAPARRLPGALVGQEYDLLSVTSHGSLVTGRTVGLLVRQAPVLVWIRRHGPLFYSGTPYGSSEDMLAMAMLSKLGELWSVPAAQVADQVRGTPGATRAQQFAWGYDHAWLAGALSRAGLVTPGVHALAWTRDGWEQSGADWGRGTGYLINPTELRLGCRLLRALTAAPEAAREVFGPNAEKVAVGTELLWRVLNRWRAGTVGTVRIPRPDLPPLASRGWDGLRDGLDALLGHLAGNVAGSADNGAEPGAWAPDFLYGARQPAVADPAWSPGVGRPVPSAIHVTERLELAWPTGSASSAPGSSPGTGSSMP